MHIDFDEYKEADLEWFGIHQVVIGKGLGTHNFPELTRKK